MRQLIGDVKTIHRTFFVSSDICILYTNRWVDVQNNICLNVRIWKTGLRTDYVKVYDENVSKPNLGNKMFNKKLANLLRFEDFGTH